MTAERFWTHLDITVNNVLHTLLRLGIARNRFQKGQIENPNNKIKDFFRRKRIIHINLLSLRQTFIFIEQYDESKTFYQMF